MKRRKRKQRRASRHSALLAEQDYGDASPNLQLRVEQVRVQSAPEGRCEHQAQTQLQGKKGGRVGLRKRLRPNQNAAELLPAHECGISLYEVHLLLRFFTEWRQSDATKHTQKQTFEYQPRRRCRQRRNSFGHPNSARPE